jgi:hypothetical protein
MIPANWAVWMLEGIECARIEPASPAGTALLECLPDHFWDQLGSARDDESIMAAYTWGRKWMIAHWMDIRRDFPPALWRAAGPTPPASPAPQAETGTTPREEAGPGIPVEDDVLSEPDPESESVDAARERVITRLLKAVKKVSVAGDLLKRNGGWPQLALLIEQMAETAEELAEFAPPETPEQMGWVDGRGLP